ncbi:MAG: hypothetical protein JXB39_07420 [Deltaproteobacteria bacterium]|nr:hypothetical protein [Deltaproteobacteria bacterium]
MILAALLLAACGPDRGDTGLPPFPGDFVPPAGFWAWEGPDRLLVTEVDPTWQAGYFGVVDPASGAWIAEGGQAHTDAVAACAGAFLLVINRMGADNLQFVDPRAGTVVAQWSTGEGSNPQSVVFWGEEAWVTLYEETGLLVADWTTGTEIARVDLSRWADADGIPEASQAFAWGGILWVTLERMDRTASWTPAGESVLLGIDPASRAVVVEIPLGLGDVNGGWTVEDGIASSAASGALWEPDGTTLALDGGIVRVDLAARAVAGVPLTEAQVGRDVRAALTQGDRAWISTYDEDLDNRLEAWDLAHGRQVAALPEAFVAGWHRTGAGDVWIAEHSAARLRRIAWEDGAALATLPTLARPVSVRTCEAGL